MYANAFNWLIFFLIFFLLLLFFINFFFLLIQFYRYSWGIAPGTETGVVFCVRQWGRIVETFLVLFPPQNPTTGHQTNHFARNTFQVPPKNTTAFPGEVSGVY